MKIVYIYIFFFDTHEFLADASIQTLGVEWDLNPRHIFNKACWFQIVKILHTEFYLQSQTKTIAQTFNFTSC